MVRGPSVIWCSRCTPHERRGSERLARSLGAEPSEAAVADLLWAVVMLPEFRFIL